MGVFACCWGALAGADRAGQLIVIHKPLPAVCWLQKQPLSPYCRPQQGSCPFEQVTAAALGSGDLVIVSKYHNTVSSWASCKNPACLTWTEHTSPAKYEEAASCRGPFLIRSSGCLRKHHPEPSFCFVQEDGDLVEAEAPADGDHDAPATPWQALEKLQAARVGPAMRNSVRPRMA